MPSVNLNSSSSVYGKTFQEQRTVTADGAVIKDPTLAAAKTGTLTTRTDDNTGTLTMAGGHGITTGQRLDVYWSGGARYGMTVGTVATNSVPIDGGGGDVLPAAATAITAMVPVLEDFVVEAADLAALLVGCASPAYAVFLESDNTLVKAAYIGGSTSSYQWDEDSAADNPFGADVAKVYLSHGYASGTRQVNAVALAN